MKKEEIIMRNNVKRFGEHLTGALLSRLTP
jgi:hypothetical protein